MRCASTLCISSLLDLRPLWSGRELHMHLRRGAARVLDALSNFAADAVQHLLDGADIGRSAVDLAGAVGHLLLDVDARHQLVQRWAKKRRDLLDVAPDAFDGACQQHDLLFAARARTGAAGVGPTASSARTLATAFRWRFVRWR